MSENEKQVPAAVWNLANFQGSFVISGNKRFFDNLLRTLADSPELVPAMSVQIPQEDAQKMAAKLEQAFESGLKNGSLERFAGRLKEQLAYLQGKQAA